MGVASTVHSAREICGPLHAARVRSAGSVRRLIGTPSLWFRSVINTVQTYFPMVSNPCSMVKATENFCSLKAPELAEISDLGRADKVFFTVNPPSRISIGGHHSRFGTYDSIPFFFSFFFLKTERELYKRTALSCRLRAGS
jgi:hypothetical protein